MSPQLLIGDCLTHLAKLAGRVELVFADPPYNIGYGYDVYDDRRAYDEYVAWTGEWIKACAEALTPTGSAFFMIGDEYAAETRLAVREAGLALRNWIVWHYTFGQNMQGKFGRSHVHIFYAVKDAKRFTFNDHALRVPSLRGMQYNDTRANPIGRLPEDTWGCYPRVCGTFKARQGWHGCQLPEDLLARIITGASNPGDVVLDPFAGSGTTLVVARDHGRQAIGIELSEEYARRARERLDKLADSTVNELGWPARHVRELVRFYRETDYPLSAFADRPFARDHFTAVFNRRLGTSYNWDAVHAQLCGLRAALPVVRPVDQMDEADREADLSDPSERSSVIERLAG